VQARKAAVAQAICERIAAAAPDRVAARAVGPMAQLCLTLRDLAHDRRTHGALSAKQVEALGHPDSDASRAFVARLTRRAAEWAMLPPLSHPPPVDGSTAYRDVVTIARIGEHFKMLDGNSHPRVVVLHLSDGTEYKELLKGGEDLRQDAVMQQVFVFANSRLQHRTAGRARLPRMRTYGVVPLSQTSGTAGGDRVVETPLGGGGRDR